MLAGTEHNKTLSAPESSGLQNSGKLDRFLPGNIPLVLTILSVLLFLYVAMRAYLMSLTHDECFTYLEYVRKDWLTASTMRFTNNHLLNTWLMKAASSIFGNSEFVLRLPNVLFFAVYLYYGTKLSLQLRSALFSISGWILLNFNPFVLDFFSLARGYGISMGLLMMSFYYAFKWITDNNGIKNSLLVMIPLCISILANLTFVNLLISFSIVLILFASLKNKSKSKYKTILWTTIIFIISGFFTVWLIIRLRQIGNFDFGGNAGLWQDTVISLISSSLYGVFSLNDIIKGVVIFFLAALALFCLFLFIRIISGKNDSKDLFAAIIFFVLVLCLSAIWLQHKLFGIPYAMDRTVLYLVPLASLLYVFVFNNSRSWLIRNTLIVLPAGIAVLIFGLSFNLSHTLLWWYDHNTKNFMKGLDKRVMINPVINSAVIGVHQLYWPSYNYYRMKYNLWDLNPARYDDDFTNKDYQYYLHPGKGNSVYLAEGNVNKEYKVIKARHLIKTDEEPENTGGAKMPHYSVMLRDTVDEAYCTLLAYFSCEIKSDTPAKDAAMVFSVRRDDKTVMWKNISIHEYPVNKDSWTKASCLTFLPDSLKPGDEISAYIWTLRKCRVSIKRMDLVLLD